MISPFAIIGGVFCLAVIAGCAWYLATSLRDHNARVRAEMQRQTAMVVNSARAAYIDDANDTAAWADVEATFARQDRDWAQADRIAADPALMRANFGWLIAQFDLDEVTRIQRVLDVEVRP